LMSSAGALGGGFAGLVLAQLGYGGLALSATTVSAIVLSALARRASGVRRSARAPAARSAPPAAAPAPATTGAHRQPPAPPPRLHSAAGPIHVENAGEPEPGCRVQPATAGHAVESSCIFDNDGGREWGGSGGAGADVAPGVGYPGFAQPDEAGWGHG